MTPERFIQTLYLGDRACKRVSIDGWAQEVGVQVDCISRIRSDDGVWHFYVDEDVEDGWIVFEGVSALTFDPPGSIPNDYISSFTVKALENRFLFQLHVASISARGDSLSVTISVEAIAIFIRDPRFPDNQIRS